MSELLTKKSSSHGFIGVKTEAELDADAEHMVAKSPKEEEVEIKFEKTKSRPEGSNWGPREHNNLFGSEIGNIKRKGRTKKCQQKCMHRWIYERE